MIPLKSGPGGVEDERQEDDEGAEGSEPPHVSALGLTEATRLRQGQDSIRHPCESLLAVSPGRCHMEPVGPSSLPRGSRRAPAGNVAGILTQVPTPWEVDGHDIGRRFEGPPARHGTTRTK